MTAAVDAVANVFSTGSKSARPSPFRGLEPYSKDDRGKLFGRDTDLLMVRDRIFAAPTTVLMAAAGAGKTSFIDALLAPDLAERFAEHYDVLVHRSWSYADPWSLIEQLLTKRRSGCGLILVLDQFEEVFQHAPSSLAFDNLRAGLRELTAQSRVRVVLSLREDFLAQLLSFDDVMCDVLRNYHRLAPPSREQAIDIVIRTARPTPVNEDGVERLIDGLAFENGVITLPHLQIASRRLWLDESKNSSSALEFLAAFAGHAPNEVAAHERIVELMKAHLLEQLAALNTNERKLAAHAVNFLVTSQGAKLPYEIKSLAKHMGEKEQAVLPALEKLSQARVLKQSQRDDETWFELYHDMYAGALFEWSRRLEQERRDRLINTVVASVVIVLIVVGAVLVGYRAQAKWQQAELLETKRLATEKAKAEQRYHSLLSRAQEREGLELPGEALLLRLAALALVEGTSLAAPDSELKAEVDEDRRQVARLMRQQRSLRATLRMEGANARAFFLANGNYLATVSEVTSAVDPGALKSGPKDEPNAPKSAQTPVLGKPPLRSLVQLWSVATGQPYREALVASGQISAADLSHDGRFLALKDGSQTQVWDLGSEQVPRKQLLVDSCADARFLTHDGRESLIVKCQSPFKLRSYSGLPEPTFEPFTYPDADASVHDEVMLMYPGGTARLDPQTFKVMQRYDLSSGERPLQVEASTKWVWALTRLASKRLRLVVFAREKGDYQSRTSLSYFFGDAVFSLSPSGESALIGQHSAGFGLQELSSAGQVVAELPFFKALVPRSASADSRWLALQPADWGSDRLAIWDVKRPSDKPNLVAVPVAIGSGLDISGDAWLQGNAQATQLMSGEAPSSDGVSAQVLSTTESAVLYRAGNQIHFWDVVSGNDLTPPSLPYVAWASISGDNKQVAFSTLSDVTVWDVKSNALKHVAISLNASEEISLSPRGQRLLVSSWAGSRLVPLGDSTPAPEPLQSSGAPGGVKWSPDGEFFTLRQKDSLFAAASVRDPVQVPFGGSNRIAVFSPDATWLLSGGSLGARLTPLGGGQVVDYDGLGPPALAAFSRDSSLFAVMSESREVHLVDVKTRRMRSATTLRGAPRQLLITPDGNGLLVASDRFLHLYRPEPGSPETLRLVGSRQLAGSWSGMLHFQDDQGFQVLTLTGTAESYVRRESVAFRGAGSEAPLQRSAAQLLDEWSKRLGMSVSNDDVSVVGVIGAPKPPRADQAPGGQPKEPVKPRNNPPAPRPAPTPRAPSPGGSANPP